MKSKILGVYYEHPEWFEKFFSKLDEKGIDHIKMEALQIYKEKEHNLFLLEAFLHLPY